MQKQVMQAVCEYTDADNKSSTSKLLTASEHCNASPRCWYQKSQRQSFAECCLALGPVQYDSLVSLLKVSKCVCVAAAYSQKRLSALPQLDGLTATMMDEALLMREPLLRHYWSSVARFSREHCEDMIKGNIDAVQVSCHHYKCSLQQAAGQAL